MARAFREDLTTAAGPHQFAVGRPEGAEVMQKAAAVAAEHRPAALGVKYDFKNVYNSLTRDAVRAGRPENRMIAIAAAAGSAVMLSVAVGAGVGAGLIHRGRRR